MSYSIREAVHADKPDILRFWWELQSQASQPFGGPGDDWSVRAESIIDSAMVSNQACLLLAVNDGHAIATLSGHVFDKPGVVFKRVAVLYSLWVETEYRKQGIASELLETLIIKMKTIGAECCQVGWDATDLQAQDWWQSKGFTPYEVIASKNA